MTADSWLKEERLTDSLIPPIHQPPTFSRFLFSREQEKKNPTLPLFPFFRPPEFLRSLRKGYATRNYRRFRGKRKKRRLNRGNVTRVIFRKRKIRGRYLRKKSRTNQFSPESILREFRGNDKNCMERPLSGRRRGRREKTKKKKKKKKEKMKKRKKKRQSIFER